MNQEQKPSSPDIENTPRNRHQRRKQAANMRHLIKKASGKKVSAPTSEIVRAMKG